MVTLGAVLTGGLLGSAACATGAVGVQSAPAKRRDSRQLVRPKVPLLARRPKRNLDHGAAAGRQPVKSESARGARRRDAAASVSFQPQDGSARRVNARDVESQRTQSAPVTRRALQLDNVFDPDFTDGPEPLPALPHGFIAQSFGTQGESSTAGAITLPLSDHWAASAEFAHGVHDIFAYTDAPGGAENRSRIEAVPGSVNYTALHAQAMFRPDSHFMVMFGVTSSNSNLTVNPASTTAHAVNY